MPATGQAPGATILGCAGPRLGAAERRFFRAADPWGFILFERNLDTPDQIRALTQDLRETVGRAAPILIDQEGGRVQRLGPPRWRGWPPPLDHVRAAGPLRAADAMRLRYRMIAHELSALGIDVDCAPVADIADADTHPVLRNRCYGDTADMVAQIARAVAEGLLAGGVLPVAKHIPGHGRARVDSHADLPHVADPPAALAARDFAPFRALADLPMAMTAHVLFSALDASAPATISPRIVSMLRDEIGFQGLLMTDDISMRALRGSIAARSRQAIVAGCDLVLHCNGDPEEMAQAVDAAGRMTPAAARRAEAALARRRPPVPIDIARLEADLEVLVAGQVDG